MITRSDRLDHVHSDIRGPLYQEALRMESEGGEEQERCCYRFLQ